jgi:hypothetical protein
VVLVKKTLIHQTLNENLNTQVAMEPKIRLFLKLARLSGRKMICLQCVDNLLAILTEEGKNE